MSYLLRLSACLFFFVSFNAFGATLFSSAAAVSYISNSAYFNFDTPNGNEWSFPFNEGWSEDGILVSAPSGSNGGWQIQSFYALDLRIKNFIRINGAITDNISISLADGSPFYAIDLMIGDGQGGTDPLTNLSWSSYSDGQLISQSIQENLQKGSIIGWVDEGGITELRLAAHQSLDSLIMHGRNGIAIDDVRIQNSPVPLPAGIYLFLSGLVGLGLIKRRSK